MGNLSRFTCFIFVLVSAAVLCTGKITRVSRSVAGPSSQSKFQLLVKEQGSHFTEKVKFDMKSQTIVYKVPLHRNIDRAEILSDYVMNLTVTRLPDRNVCYIRPHDVDEPSLKELQESMKLVSSKKVVKKSGVDMRSSEQTVKGPADLSKLRSNVVQFCGGLAIYELEILEKDEITVLNGKNRKKRAQMKIKLCKSIFKYDLSKCPSETQWNYNCLFPSHSCVYRVTCNGLVHVRDTNTCSDQHLLVSVLCCDLECK